MEVEGLTFRATTTSQEDHNANFIDRPKKRNHDERFDRGILFTTLKRLLPQNDKKNKIIKDHKGGYCY